MTTARTTTRTAVHATERPSTTAAAKPGRVRPCALVASVVVATSTSSTCTSANSSFQNATRAAKVPVGPGVSTTTTAATNSLFADAAAAANATVTATVIATVIATAAAAAAAKPFP